MANRDGFSVSRNISSTDGRYMARRRLEASDAPRELGATLKAISRHFFKGLDYYQKAECNYFSTSSKQLLS